ncbi:putative gustatory receptor 28b [Tribolium castaneum]|uniref:putative gustatory receptor 28b n=1 Tax=Tribolium castaneum TaxID=7070 RepID=UPI0030FE0B58
MKEVPGWRNMKPLYYLCNFLAVTPPHSLGNTVTPVSLRFKLYTIVHIFIIIALYAHSSYGRENFIYGSMNMTVAITDKIANFMLTFFNVSLRIILVFSKGKVIKSFFNQGYELSKQEIFNCCSKKSFRMNFAIFNLYMVLLLLFDAYLWISSVGVRMFQYYIGRSFTYYVCNTTIFLIFHSVLPIKRFFTSLGIAFDNIMKNLICEIDGRHEFFLAEFKSAKTPPNKLNCYDLRRVRKNYNSICELVDAFNNIYGLAMLEIIIVVITYVLNLTDLFLVYGMSKSRNIEGVSFGTNLVILCALWITTLLLFTILLAYGCAGATSEAEKIAKICFYWLNEIPTMPVSIKDQTIKEELALLAQQSTSRTPKFSAAGFFPVDFTLLGFIFGSVTSYIIISIQFIE